MSIAEQFIGSWELEGFVSAQSGGATSHPLGDRPEGILTYTGDGVMSVHLLAQPGRSETKMADYTGYYGSFTIDEARAVISHHVEGASVEGLGGTVQERSYRFHENKLELSAVGSRNMLKLTWTRR